MALDFSVTPRGDVALNVLGRMVGLASNSG